MACLGGLFQQLQIPIFQKHDTTWTSTISFHQFLAGHYNACRLGDTGHHHKQWDYSSSLFFAGTVVTTIGE